MSRVLSVVAGAAIVAVPAYAYGETVPKPYGSMLSTALAPPYVRHGRTLTDIQQLNTFHLFSRNSCRAIEGHTSEGGQVRHGDRGPSPASSTLEVSI